MLIVFTARFIIKQILNFPTYYIYLFLVDPRTNSEYFRVRINNIPVFITETGCVLCAVRTGRLNIIWVSLYSPYHGTGS